MGVNSSVILYLPNINRATIESVTSLSSMPSTELEVVIPSSLDGLNLSLFEELQSKVVRLSTFATNPVSILATHHELTIAVATKYELSRIAISMHFQNLCDLLRKKYHSASIRDVDVRKALLSGHRIIEVRPGVFRSQDRIKLDWPREVVNQWFLACADRFGTGVWDLPQYLDALEDWYSKLAVHRFYASRYLESIPKGAWAEITGDDGCFLVKGYTERSASWALRADDGWSLIRDAQLSLLTLKHKSPIPTELLTHLRRGQTIRKKLTASGMTATQTVQVLCEYADTWMDTIPDAKARGQEQKWRGWYLVPEHGPLTMAKLQELTRILRAIKGPNQQSFLIDKSQHGIANAVALLEAGQVSYKGKHSQAAKRDLFVRQQKNYLLRLGLIREIDSRHIGLTDQGSQWTEATSEKSLRIEYLYCLENLRWTWCNMPFFTFLRDLVSATGGYVTLSELFNWVIHAYDQNQMAELVSTLELYRGLSKVNQEAVDCYVEESLKTILGTYRTTHAFGHYRRKVIDLMSSFSATGIFREDRGTSLHIVDFRDHEP